MSERGEPALSISESASLERGYRRLLAWYPTWFRQENEEEVLAVLMACAQDDQTRPSLEAAVDLLKGAARMRLRPRPGQPRTVFAAVRLMYLAALAEVGAVLTIVATAATVRSTVAHSYPALVSAASTRMMVNEVLAPIVIALWVLLARAISRRRDPARIGVAAFFGLITMTMIGSSRWCRWCWSSPRRPTGTSVPSGPWSARPGKHTVSPCGTRPRWPRR
jgi:hypothetical protein